MLKRILLFWTIVFFSVCALSAQDLMISGKVTALSGEPLPFAQVVVEGTVTGVICDVDGNFSLEISDEEKVSLRASLLGYAARTVSVNPEEGKTSYTVSFELEEEAATLGAVTVSARSSATVTRESGYGVEVLETKGYENLSADLNQILQTTPGIRQTPAVCTLK
ncbi:carboxypeptidase-like regulatory domain-containing protein [Neolewinella aurantiaca]|nr:carboxypeptidase-like regulatory domain-containing protein [Neolewinella aurantiaca]